MTWLKRNAVSSLLIALIVVVSFSDFKVSAFEWAVMIIAVGATISVNSLTRPYRKE